MIIVILGPDGSGKTTLAKGLAEKIDKLSYLYFGSNPESRKYPYFNTFLSKNKKGKFNTFLKYICISINDYHYYRLGVNSHYIADRCPIDKLVGYDWSHDKGRYLYHKITQLIMPKPDFAILLYGNINILYDRKKEIPIEIIEKYIKFYRTYLSRNKIRNLEIDTTKNDTKKTLEISYNIIRGLL